MDTESSPGPVISGNQSRARPRSRQGISKGVVRSKEFYPSSQLTEAGHDIVSFYSPSFTQLTSPLLRPLGQKNKMEASIRDSGWQECSTGSDRSRSRIMSPTRESGTRVREFAGLRRRIEANASG